jgi:hypothetical protein
VIRLDNPAQLRIFVWQRQGRRGAWAQHMAVLTHHIPEPGEFLETGAALIRVRHIGVSVVLGDEGFRLWGEIVTAPPR